MTTSLIIPVYNEADYIPLLVQSIRNSSIKPDEILFCDNNSTDDSIRVIQQTCKELPYIILKEPKKGIIPTVERLWRAAKGDIILKVDADSVIPVHWIRNVLKHFTDNPKLAACTGPVLSSDGSKILKYIINISYLTGMFLYKFFRGHTMLIGPNCAFRNTALQSVNGYVWYEYDLDDQIISRKLSRNGHATKWFKDMVILHSTRRYQQSPQAFFESLISNINPKYYTVKS